MEIDTLSVNQEILAQIALCGEIPFKPKINGINNKYINDQITRMKNQRLIISNKQADRIRLIKAGRDWLQVENAKLFMHHKILTGDDITYISADRMNNISRINYFFMSHDSHIDNIKLIYRPGANNFGKGNRNSDITESVLGGSSFFGSALKTFPDDKSKINSKDLFSNLEMDERYFYSNRIVKTALTEAKLQLSINGGFYFSNGNSYVVYRLPELDRASTDAAEKSARDVIRTIHALAYGRESSWAQTSASPLGQCIILEPTYDETRVIKLINSHKIREAFAPRRIYSDFFIVPEDNNLSASPVTILSTQSFREKLHAGFLLSDEIRYHLNKNPNMPIYEFLSCNYSNMLKIRSRKPEEFIIVCMKWQEELLRFLFRGYKNRAHIVIFE